MKVLVLGYKRSGKSLAAEYIADLLKSNRPINTSDILIQDLSRELNIEPNEILNNKEEYRTKLFNLGRQKQSENVMYPIDIALTKTDVITGVRPRDSFEAAKGHFDKVLWINREGTEKGPTDQLEPSDADIIIDNNGNKEDLKNKLEEVFKVQEHLTVTKDAQIMLNGALYLLEKGDKVKIINEEEEIEQDTGTQEPEEPKEEIKAFDRMWEVTKSKRHTSINTLINGHRVDIIKLSSGSYIEIDGKRPTEKMTKEVLEGIGISSPSNPASHLLKIKETILSQL